MVEGHLAFLEYSQRLASNNKLVRGKMCNIKRKTYIYCPFHKVGKGKHKNCRTVTIIHGKYCAEEKKVRLLMA